MPPSNAKYLGVSSAQKDVARLKIQRGHIPAMDRHLFDSVLIGRRLEAIRLVKEAGTQQEFAEAIGVSRNRYNNWACGVGPIPIAQAAKVKELTGATLDYIYLGELSGLPLALAKALAEAEASLG